MPCGCVFDSFRTTNGGYNLLKVQVHESVYGYNLLKVQVHKSVHGYNLLKVQVHESVHDPVMFSTSLSYITYIMQPLTVEHYTICKKSN
jgi:hypothetical protein